MLNTAAAEDITFITAELKLGYSLMVTCSMCRALVPGASTCGRFESRIMWQQRRGVTLLQKSCRKRRASCKNATDCK